MPFLKLEQLTTREPFVSLFPINPSILEAITEGMRASRTFDKDEPIIVWRQSEQTRIVIDGHTRLRAAIEAGLSRADISDHEFADEDEAIAYALRRQVHRRNLGDAELARYVLMLDKRRQSGERTDLASPDARLGKSAAATAELLGTSQAKVERTRTVIDHADEETKEAVLAGEKTINAAYQETQQRRRAKPKTLPAEADVEGLQIEAEKLRAEIEELQSEADTLAVEVDLLQMEAVELRAEIEGLQGEAEELRAEVGVAAEPIPAPEATHRRKPRKPRRSTAIASAVLTRGLDELNARQAQ